MSQGAGSGTEDTVRGFPAFPPRRGGQGRSWWARAWVRALEDTSLDRAQLVQGRRYAATGRVGTITVSPGRLAAPVLGADGTPYNTVVFVDRLTPGEWERFLEQVAAKAGRIAALLDRDMPHDLVDAAEEAGVRLLPGVGDLEPECDCPDWELPCRHAAALAYQVSWLLDEDPLLLMLLRGRGERELLTRLQRYGDSAPERSQRDPAHGIPAAEAFARGVPVLPDPPPLPADHSPLPTPAAAPGVDPAALVLLAADAALRARDWLASTDDAPPPVLNVWQDTVRLAATHPGAELLERLRRACGRPDELPRAAQAWGYGGLAGLRVLEEVWSPPRPELARARSALGAAWADEEGGVPPELSVHRNHWTLIGRGLQLRYGPDGRWYPYREEDDGWWPIGPPERNPATALADLLGG
ncbi:SWIM zinc finger family protein [Streptomyces sp. NPDC020096]